MNSKNLYEESLNFVEGVKVVGHVRLDNVVYPDLDNGNPVHKRALWIKMHGRYVLIFTPKEMNELGLAIPEDEL